MQDPSPTSISESAVLFVKEKLMTLNQAILHYRLNCTYLTPPSIVLIHKKQKFAAVAINQSLKLCERAPSPTSGVRLDPGSLCNLPSFLPIHYSLAGTSLPTRDTIPDGVVYIVVVKRRVRTVSAMARPRASARSSTFTIPSC